MHSFYKMIYVYHLIHNFELAVHHPQIFNLHGRPKQLSSVEQLVDYNCS